MTQDKIH